MKKYWLIKLGEQQFCFNQTQLMYLDAGLHIFSYKLGSKFICRYKILATIKCKSKN